MNIIDKSVKKEADSNNFNNGVSEDDARHAIKTLLRWIGEDPEREGLVETTGRETRKQ